MPCRRAQAIAGALATRTLTTRALPKLKVQPAPTLKLLEATAAFVPQVFADDPRQLQEWNRILSAALADIRSSNPRPLRLVVCGTGTGAHDLVTALLEQPFASDAEQTQTLRERWAAAPPDQTSLTIEYGNLATEGSLPLHLAYLDQFPVPLQVVEAADPAMLQTADVGVLVTRLDELHSLTITRPDTLVVLDIDETDFHRRASTSTSTAPRGKYLFVSPSQALSALTALRNSLATPEAVQRYQASILASRMPTVIQSLHTILASFEDTSMLRNRTALAQVRSALAACSAAIRDAKAELNRLSAGVSDLDALVEGELVKVHRDVLGRPDDHAVDRALSKSTSRMKGKIDYMSKWHRSMWTVDEITTNVTQIVWRVWCTDLEKELVFHAGRLQHMQRIFTDRTFDLLAPSNTRALHSPILDNALRQLTTAPDFPVRPSTLTEPFSACSRLILDVPTARLHVSGQRALLGMGGAIATGMGISWAGYFGYSANLEPGTAVATGMLVALLGVHWASWRWKKGMKRWWDDFMRVAGGLKQDVTVRGGQTFLVFLIAFK
ncbi:hypothetical protein GGX14DRAFT_591612 [Mycena pura]|uniref:Uncharacterized protein n=1 Tax=Mycena pura TaxID=153505 RepID=A0AAD6VPR7_9AGAR|nr:hypothetical protein GGX14DRAFT_591612 [Mycena pura]